MTAGYSGTPLERKLGIEAGMRLVVVDEPAGWVGANLDLPEGVALADLRARSADLFLVFVGTRGDLERRIDQVVDRLPADVAVWVAWPKRASGVPTDVTEDVVRQVTHPYGLVDVKVAALDATWSGLKVVVRREFRPDWLRAAGRTPQRPSPGAGRARRPR